MKILAVDPGGTTGIARGHFVYKDKMPMYFETFMPKGFNDSCANLVMQFCDWRLPDLVVIEKFTITAETAKKTTAGSKTDIELCGVARFLARQYGVPLEEQSPADAKNFMDDKKLRRLGIYTPGPDHARDATRHLFLAAIRHQVLDPRLLLPQV